MADLGKCWESFKTPWISSYKACKCISNYFRQCWWRFRVNSEGSEIGRFLPKSLGYSPWFWKWRIWVNVGIRSKLPESPPTCFSNYFRQCWWRFRVNSEGSEIGRFWRKSLGYSPWFWKWRIWVSVGNRSKLPESPPTRLANAFPTTFDNVGEDFGWIPKGPKSADFYQKAWAIAHGFENGGFG